MSFQKNMALISKKIDSYLGVKKVSFASIISNSVSIALGVAFIAYKEYTVLWDIFGGILIFTLYWNIFQAFYIGNKLNKNEGLGRRLYLLSYVYLTAMILAMIGIMLGNLLISARYSNNNLGLNIFVYFCYFGILSFGISISLIALKNKNNNLIWSVDKGSKPTNLRQKSKAEIVIKKILKRFSVLMFLIGFYLGITVAFGVYFDILFIPTMLSGQFGIFFSVIFLSNAIIMLKLLGKEHKPRRYYRFALIAIILSALFILPLLSTPATYYAADANFSQAFGNDWREKIPSEIEEKYF